LQQNGGELCNWLSYATVRQKNTMMSYIFNLIDLTKEIYDVPYFRSPEKFMI